MKLAFEPIWPWPFVILACLAMIGVVAAGYPRRVKHLPVRWQQILLAIRILLVLLMGLWLMRPLVTRETDNKSGGVLYVVLDASRSMNTPDAAGGVSRRAEILQLLEEARPLLNDLKETVEVRFRDLADGLVPADPEDPLAVVDGQMTAIGYGLNQLSEESKGEKVAAILFWSDGKQAASGNRNQDAIQEARLIGRKQRPIYTVPVGSSEVASTTLDVAVSELDVPHDVFVGNVVPIRVRVRTFGSEGQELRIRLYAEDRSGIPSGKAGTMEAIPGNIDNVTVFAHQPRGPVEDMIVNLQFVPDKKHLGEIKIAVVAEPLNGEVRLTNNRVETIVRVRSGGIRVAYFDSLRAEFKWLKRVNRNNRIQLDAKWLKGGDNIDKNTFDESWFDPSEQKYDAFIIGDVPAAAFGEERLKQMAACCDRGAGLMMIGGAHSFGPGGYNNTPLAQLLPIDMQESDQQLTADIQMIPARVTLTILQIAAPDQNLAMWNALPPLTGASVLRVKQGGSAQVLATSPTNMPLLVSQSTGRGRVLVFGGDTTWQWAMHEDWAVEAHQRFWRQLIYWVTKMDYDGESPLWVNVEPRDLNPGRVAELSFGMRDQNGLPLSGVNYQVNVQTPEGETEVVTPRTVDAHGAADYQDTLLPGDYWVNVKNASTDGQGTLYASTRFLVNARDPELDNPAADPGLLREIAHVSGGDFLTSETMIERLEDWAANGLPSLDSKQSERINLWDNWFSLLLFVVLLVLEWFFRKKRGLV
jgi:hypothetical protein